MGEAEIIKLVTELGVEIGLPILIRELEKLGGRDAVLGAHDALLAAYRAQVDEDLAKKHG